MSEREFPKYMTHPGYRPAVLDDETNAGGMTMGLKRGNDFDFMPRVVPKSKPEWMPPVTVMNEDQQAYHESRGYRVVKTMAPPPQRAYAPSLAHPPQPQTPSGLDPREWPKWVEGKLCLTPSDEAKALSKAGKLGADIPWSGLPRPPIADESPDPDELAEFRAWKAGKAGAPRHKKRVFRKPPTNPDRGTPEQGELIVLCTAAGLKVDTRYSIRRMREMLRAAMSSEANHAVTQRKAEEVHGGGVEPSEEGGEDRHGNGHSEAA